MSDHQNDGFAADDEPVWYRVGGSQPQNIYRVHRTTPDGAYIGVMFNPVDAEIVVEALNAFGGNE